MVDPNFHLEVEFDTLLDVHDRFSRTEEGDEGPAFSNPLRVFRVVAARTCGDVCRMSPRSYELVEKLSPALLAIPAIETEAGPRRLLRSSRKSELT